MIIMPIWVNNHEIGRMELFRTSPLDNPVLEDVVCTYVVRYYNGNPYPAFEGTIDHPYVPKNPLPLVIAALNKIEVMKRD